MRSLFFYPCNSSGVSYFIIFSAGYFFFLRLNLNRHHPLMRRVFTVFILGLLFSVANAQNSGVIIKGVLLDTTGKEPIADATISVLRDVDSSLVTFSLSNREGVFEIKGLANGAYQLIITHQAWLEIKKLVSVSDDKMLVDLGQIHLSKDYKTLGEVIITNESPIVVKEDTIQFNTSGFKTPPNATVEDLLKKLPGVEVDKEGNVKSQGEEIQKIYVDGKEFFGNDPKLATKNLTADMVESVQVFEDMSDQAKFTKIDDGNRIKTLNIKLKKDRNKGYFGRALAGYGDDGKYQGNLNLSKFNGEQRLSLIFNSNNINKQGYSADDNAGNNPGITRSLSTGLNYSDRLGHKIKVTGSYFFSNS